MTGTTPVVYVEDTRPTMHYGSGAPSSALGADGDTYLDVPGTTIYGPKAAGAWGSGTSLQGPQGEQGEPGSAGGGSAVETGTLVPYAGLSAPSGYLFANGASKSRTTYADLWAALHETIDVATISVANPAVVTCAGHGLVDGDAVYFSTTGALPTGLSAETTYYVADATTNTFELAASVGGASIATTVAGSGTHTLVNAPWGGVTATNFALPDMRGRTFHGVDDMGVSAAGRLATYGTVVGHGGGTETHALVTAELPSHSHGAGTLVTDDPGTHTHTIDGLNGLGAANELGAGSLAAAPSGVTYTTGADGDHTHSLSGSTASAGSGSAHNNMAPNAKGNWIIKT
jgi:microcystin-dependent protein